MQKLIIVDHEPLTIRRKSLFYIDTLISKGINLEFWDCSLYFYPGIIVADEIEEQYVRKISTYETLQLFLDKEDVGNTIYVVEAFESWNNRKFWRLFAKKGCFMIKQEMFATANLAQLPFKERFCNLSLRELFDAFNNKIESLLWRFYVKLNGIAFSMSIGSGNYRHFDVHINHKDWEDYQILKNVPKISLGRYAVFVDEYFPLHPDLVYFNHQKPKNVVHYREIMNRFFRVIETKYKLEIIIAAHPKSQYDNNTFDGRKIVKYKTVELIKNAEMVFMHSSAALSFIVMFDKPLAIIVTDDYWSNKILRLNLLRVSRMLKRPFYNIEHTIDFPIVKIEPKVRISYIYGYLTFQGIEEYRNADLLYNAYCKIMSQRETN